ncbi:response regulator receiver domain-containing protein [Sinorhizobium medicae]|nr:response regulator receiver domain-containing protein [Sinorhizobium medicae]
MVLSDINMPRMDGLSLLEKLQERNDDLSTIIISAYSDMANIRTAMNRAMHERRRSLSLLVRAFLSALSR